MYRLLTAKNISTTNFYQSWSNSKGLSSVSKNGKLERVSCSFCRKVSQNKLLLESDMNVRHHSTKSVEVLQHIAKKKTKYKKQKKYVELLQVGDSSTNQTKAQISHLKPSHLSKLAASSVTLENLHQITSKNRHLSIDHSTQDDIDYELLKSFENMFKKKFKDENSDNIHIENDKCALIFCTDGTAVNIEELFRDKVYVDKVKRSYISFRKATFRDQRFKDLNYAIKEGVKQEFDFTDLKQAKAFGCDLENREKGAHEVFRELFNPKHILQSESTEQDLLDQLEGLPTSNLPLSEHDAFDEELHEHDEMECSESVQAEILHTTKSQAAKLRRKLMQQKKQKQREISMKRTLEDVERSNKEESLNKLLLAHLQLHCFLDIVDQGKQILTHYRNKGRRMNNPKITDVKIYNTLLGGFASRGDFTTIEELLTYMKEDCILPNVHTYTAVFECIERCNSISDKDNMLRKYQHEMNEKGISLNDLLDKGKFLNDKRNYVQSAIKRIEPDFTPHYTPPDLTYKCKLLERLNKVENRVGLGVSHIEGLISPEELQERAKQQFELELKGEILVENIELSGEPTKTLLQYREKYEEMEKDWRRSSTEAFARNVSTLKSQCHASHNAITVYPYLTVLHESEFVDLIISEVRTLLDGSETYSPSLRTLQRGLGQKVYSRYQIEMKKRTGILEKIERLYGDYCEWFVDRSRITDDQLHFLNSRQVWQTLIHTNREGASLDFEEAMWPNSVCENVGKFLYKIILNDIKVDVNMFSKTSKPKKLCAVYCVHRLVGRTNRLEVKPHPAACKARRWAAPQHLSMAPELAPSCSPPGPRIAAAPHAYGGYLLAHTPLIRIPSTVQLQWKRLADSPPENMYPALDSLNQLGNVAWVINKPILDLLIKVFRSGGSKELNIARPPSALDTSEFPTQTAQASAGSKALAFKRKLAINRARAEMYSLWCDMLYKLSLANHFREKIFWLPHNMDFRGRAYACPPHLSVLGADSARAVLCFANKKPLGPDGLRWLKLHAVNLTGHHKSKTIEQRLEYAESVLHLIMDSAEKPLDGKRWWAESEDPWQTLACCMEISNAIKSGHPESYECGYPVHQDGSCNGLQHYASLGGDDAGAKAVNLHTMSRPQDVYSAVADMVEEMRARDALAGVEAAKRLEGQVKRKVIKQTVMTTVYGVTRFGARLQIAKQLKDLDGFPKEHVWQCSAYLTSRTFDSLRSMFTSTKKIQDWFTECAKLVAGVCGETVEWVTPLGMPVVQPYYRRKKTTQTLPYPSLEIQRPCTMKQKNAFPPNFIHSLDASHMMLTSLGCESAGVTFASVHDCFWTHPHTVPLMNKTCREQFVALHSEPILEDLSSYMMERYSYNNVETEDEENAQCVAKKRVNTILQQVPLKGDFDIRNVLNSIYFFS